MSLRSAEKALYACFGHIRHNLARDSNWRLAFEDTISHFDEFGSEAQIEILTKE